MVTVYAIKTELRPTPERVAQGAPYTGWVHEGQPPWRVITSMTPDLLGFMGDKGQVVPYTGDEATVDYLQLLPTTSRRIRPEVGHDTQHAE